jgi:hypothetical protein
MTGTAEPAGVCLPACATSADCVTLWGSGTCTVRTGVCTVP